jgi:hypothetical protein
VRLEKIDVATPHELKADEPAERDAHQAAEFVVVDPGCFDGGVARLRSGHTLLVKRKGGRLIGSYEIWVRGRLTRLETRRAGERGGADEGRDVEEEGFGPE